MQNGFGQKAIYFEEASPNHKMLKYVGKATALNFPQSFLKNGKIASESSCFTNFVRALQQPKLTTIYAKLKVQKLSHIPQLNFGIENFLLARKTCQINLGLEGQQQLIKRN